MTESPAVTNIAHGDLTKDLDVTSEELVALLDLASDVKRSPEFYQSALAGKAIALLFEKPSLRTRMTFELAIQQLGGFALVNEGRIGEREPLKDMARNLDRWVNGIVARTFLQKTVDGLEFPLPTSVTFKVYEVCKYVAMTNHIYNAGALMVSKQRWTQMTEADRTAFREAGKTVLPYWRETIAKASDNATGFLRQHGMQITNVDYAPFRQKMEPVFTEFRPKYQKLFDAIMAQQS